MPFLSNMYLWELYKWIHLKLLQKEFIGNILQKIGNCEKCQWFQNFHEHDIVIGTPT